MMLAGVPVLAEAVAELAGTVRAIGADALADHSSTGRPTRSGTYASFSIAAGVSLFELARFMGTSVDQIDKTYGHLLPDSLDRTRSALDAFITNTARVAEGTV